MQVVNKAFNIWSLEKQLTAAQNFDSVVRMKKVANKSLAHKTLNMCSYYHMVFQIWDELNMAS